MRRGACVLAFAIVCLAHYGTAVGQGVQTGSLHPFVLTRLIDEPPGPSGMSPVPATETAVQSRVMIRYIDPTHWSVTGQYVVAPMNPVLRRDGTLAAPFYPFPGKVVADGHRESYFNAKGQRVQQASISSAAYSPWFPGFNALSLTPQHNANLTAILRYIRVCRTARVTTTSTIYGRRALRLVLGTNRCLRISASAGYASGMADVWLDSASLLVFRLDQYKPGGGLLIRVRTTSFHWLKADRPA